MAFAERGRRVWASVLALSIGVALVPTDGDVHAQETAAQNRINPAKRQAVFKARLIDIENLFTSGASDEEARDYIQRLRQLADLAEASEVDKSARIELLRRKLSRVRAGMGGTVEVPDEKSLAMYESMMDRLRKEEESIMREIAELERR